VERPEHAMASEYGFKLNTTQPMRTAGREVYQDYVRAVERAGAASFGLRGIERSYIRHSTESPCRGAAEGHVGGPWDRSHRGSGGD
jgi:hypothetical protein